ncbi:uncharacterized protein G2W53_002321 [Senna tora]|uniref:RNase H type-1 domain-containing protein n=1 Tax=Senna tora TaxID=362788 RepID=A0A835CL36_9FABA|nr:uncharacterized protein G2W53_002321 [Senna tora]
MAERGWHGGGRTHQERARKSLVERGRLARMTMNDKKIKKHANLVEGMSEGDVNEEGGGISVEHNTRVVSIMEIVATEVSKEFEEERRNHDGVENSKVGEEETKIDVAKEISNVDPKMKTTGMKMWKRMARENGAIPCSNKIEMTGEKRKAMMYDMVVEVEEEEGVRRSIGNGRNTRVWKDPWVPMVTPSILTRPSHIETVKERVCDLLNEEGTDWDEAKLRARFDESTCLRIKSIPPDIDQGYRNDMATVWSQLDLGLDIDEGETSKFWKRLWKLPIISKYKVFLWRACLGIVPTIETLEHRGMSINESCGMCNDAPEDVYHALVDCPEIQMMWVMAKFDYSSRLFHANILEWRNRKKFANEGLKAEDLWPRVERIMDEMQVATFTDDQNKSEPTSFVWEKPEYPYKKLNVDATVCKDGGGSMGGLVRDETGVCLGAFMCSVLFPNEPVLLEAMAIKNGLKLARDIGCTHVMVESDAKIAIEMLKIPCDHASTLNAICRDILRFCVSFQYVSFNWVPRVCNSVADFISRKARVERKNVVWTDSVPLFLSEVYFADQ